MADFFRKMKPWERRLSHLHAQGSTVDLAAFTSDRLGAVRMTLDGYHAFFPAPVPRELDYDATTVKKLTEVTGRKRNRVYLSPRIMEAVYGLPDDATSDVEG